MQPRVVIPGRDITDWASFHDVFARAFGFPDFYGRNLDAWIDCLTSLDASDEGMTRVHAPPGGVVTMQIDDAAELKARCPAQFEAIVECAAFVNFRRLELGRPAVLALSFDRR